MKRKIFIPNEWRMKDTQHGDRCWWWLASLFMAAMLIVIAVACTEEPIQPGAEETEGLPATIRLEILPDAAAQAQTRANSQIDESGIKDLHILVYNSAGELIGKSYGVYSAAKPSFTVNTRSGNDNTIYAIANTENDTLFDGTVATTETKLKAMKIPALKKWDELTTASHLVMVGSKTGVAIKTGNSTLEGGITVARIAAKVTLNIGVKANSGITITNYRIFSLPKQSYYVPHTTDASTTWISDSTMTTVNAVSASKTFFMYENRKGTVESITQQKDKGGSKAPANATYIVIKGEASGYNAIWQVYLGENNTSDFNINRNGKYTYNITLSRPGTDGVDTRVDICPIIEGGNSNSYMITPFSGVAIPVERANESFLQIGTSRMLNGKCIQLEANTAWIASLVWESSKGLITLRDTTGTGPSKRFNVIATNKVTEGNAVVAIRNKTTKDILWSWHVWVTTYNGSTTFQHNGNAYNPVFMDRDLGATSVEPGNINSCGLFYQWGRKDPFPGAGQEGGNWSISNADPIRVYNRLGVSYGITKSPVPYVTPNNLTNATRNPDTFYFNLNAPLDWFIYDSSFTPNAALWSGAKSVFDPCPDGWRIPSYSNTTSPFAGMETGSRWENNGRNFGTNGYFPASGFRISNSGEIMVVGTQGSRWQVGSLCFTFNKTSALSESGCVHADGLTVRCCR